MLAAKKKYHRTLLSVHFDWIIIHILTFCVEFFTACITVNLLSVVSALEPSNLSR